MCGAWEQGYSSNDMSHASSTRSKAIICMMEYSHAHVNLTDRMEFNRLSVAVFRETQELSKWYISSEEDSCQLSTGIVRMHCAVKENSYVLEYMLQYCYIEM